MLIADTIEGVAWHSAVVQLVSSRGSLVSPWTVLDDVAYARLLARLHSMPVIEQAKGILMAESRCSANEAFAMLRAASQRSNVKVRDLAAEIVGRVSGGGQHAPAQLSAEEP